jgi:hypothetical protein
MTLSRRKFLALTGTVAAGSAVLPELAFATPITISSLPATISSSGSYVIAANHNLNMAQGAAITVNANDVTIDLQGFTISNIAAGVGTAAVGVYSLHRNRVTVRSGTLSGFHTGVMLHGERVAGGCVAEDLSLTDCTAAGIMISGSSSLIRRNVINSSLRSSAFCAASSNTGILGIGVSLAAHSRITDNVITFTNTGATDFAVAVYAGTDSDEILLLDNDITGADWGIVIDEGLGATGELRDTTITSVANKSAGGIDLDLL